MLPFFITAILITLLIIGTTKEHPEFTEEKYPIEYPMEPMMDNFKSIIIAIRLCECERDFNAAYLRIVIFQGCYPKYGSYLHELWKYLEERQAELKIFI